MSPKIPEENPKKFRVSPLDGANKIPIALYEGVRFAKYKSKFMSRPIFYKFDPGLMREELAKVRKAVDDYDNAEANLVKNLYFAECNRLYVWLGYKSLTGYCVEGLKLGRTQAARLVRAVRCFQPNGGFQENLSEDDERRARLPPGLEELQERASNKYERSATSGKKLFK